MADVEIAPAHAARIQALTHKYGALITWTVTWGVLGGRSPDPRLCAACLYIPGWYSLPEFARLIDPEHDRTVADDA